MLLKYVFQSVFTYIRMASGSDKALTAQSNIYHNQWFLLNLVVSHLIRDPSESAVVPLSPKGIFLELCSLCLLEMIALTFLAHKEPVMACIEQVTSACRLLLREDTGARCASARYHLQADTKEEEGGERSKQETASRLHLHLTRSRGAPKGLVS